MPVILPICWNPTASQTRLHAGLERERAELYRVQKELKEAQEKHNSLPGEIQHFKQDLDEETTALQRQEKGKRAQRSHSASCNNRKNVTLKGKICMTALADKESLRESKLRSLRQALDLYRARLGLQFCRGMTLRCQPQR